ncbi:MAG: hypothetical protein KH745_02530 [Bilophila sp.]|nr:hypothetical protein [Bilophila sp.]
MTTSLPIERHARFPVRMRPVKAGAFLLALAVTKRRRRSLSQGSFSPAAAPTALSLMGSPVRAGIRPARGIHFSDTKNSSVILNCYGVIFIEGVNASPRGAFAFSMIF